jgi:hypothetical protein
MQRPARWAGRRQGTSGQWPTNHWPSDLLCGSPPLRRARSSPVRSFITGRSSRGRVRVVADSRHGIARSDEQDLGGSMGTARGAPAAAIALTFCLAGSALAARGTLALVLWCTRWSLSVDSPWSPVRAPGHPAWGSSCGGTVLLGPTGSIAPRTRPEYIRGGTEGVARSCRMHRGNAPSSRSVPGG